MEGRVAPVFPASLVGHIAELLVEVYALASAGGGLTSFKPGSDVDHKDIIVDKRGDYRNAYVQVKCATHLDREGRVVGFADYDEEGVPENPRLVYLFGLLDLEAIELSRIWFVPSADFNRLAYRQHKHDRPGRVILQFSALASSESVWSQFEVTRAELGPRFLELIDSAPPAAHPVPGLVLSRT